jgi:hypothetical protein
MRKRILLFVFLVSSFGKLYAQEFQATVVVLSPTIQATNKQVFTTLERAVGDFVNSYKWSNLEYAQEERIKVSFIFNITAYNPPSSFAGNLQVQYSRPVYKSDYSSPVLNFMDSDIGFAYIENQPLDYQPNAHISNLTSILAFYCNAILGIDRASMQRGGGEAFFSQLQNIVSNAQSDGLATGWRSFDGTKSRYWLMDNLTSSAFEPIIDAYYTYHRLGMDQMHDATKQQKAKETMRDAILSFQAVFQKRPNALLITSFFDAKSDEIVSVFSDGPPIVITNLVAALKQLDAGRTGKYEALQR